MFIIEMALKIRVKSYGLPDTSWNGNGNYCVLPMGVTPEAQILSSKVQGYHH
jgi:hypothetical protein